MIANLLLAGWVAAAASWTPMTSFSLVCTGTQTAYQETTGVKQTLPWSQAYSIDLTAGTYCTQRCVRSERLSLLSSEGLVLENEQGQYSSSLKHFHAGTGAIETNTIVAASATDRFHIEQTGTCKIQPPTGPT